jgi:four helix bundle protein
VATLAEEFKKRTKQFALRVIRLVESLAQTRTSEVIGKQLLRSATSVGANDRAACRARSPQEFRAKLGIVVEEADESHYWMELLIESDLIRKSLVEKLLQEADEILAMVVASINTSRKNEREKPPMKQPASRTPKSAI